MERLSIANLLPGLTGKGVDSNMLEPIPEEENAWAPKHGPAKPRYFTAGQVRRMRKRSEAAEKRKANRKFRLEWMRNQRSVAVLRGQLEVVGAIPFADKDFEISPWSHLRSNARRALTSAYGSVEQAHEHYAGILAEARR